uniref:Uncharacterized protein n=1 Tax=Rhizophora mucronata TaxID=61149 RepID=A0A2P2QH62_RHIMU
MSMTYMRMLRWICDYSRKE